MEIPNNQFKIREKESELVRAEIVQQQSSGLASRVQRKMWLFRLDYIFHLKNKSMNAWQETIILIIQ